MTDMKNLVKIMPCHKVQYRHNTLQRAEATGVAMDYRHAQDRDEKRYLERTMEHGVYGI